MRESPFISIVMPSFNQAPYIAEAINSVLEQDYPHRELIVIDGGSTDGACEVIASCARQLAYWHSAKDRGQSNAINMGMAKASGEVLTWLNSDDVLLPGALSRVASAFARGTRHSDWLTGSSVWLSPDGHAVRCARGTPWMPALHQRGLISVGGPSSFFSRRLWDKCGPLNENLHYMMDTDLWLRMANDGIRYTQSPAYLWGLRLQPNAKMSGHNFADSPFANPDHPVWVNRRREQEWISRTHRATPFNLAVARTGSRVFRMVTLATPRGVIDSWRFRGRHWTTFPASHG